MSAQDVAHWLDTAHLPGAVKRLTQLNKFEQAQIAMEVARFERIREGHHALPDLLPIFHGNQPDYSRGKTGLPRVLFGPREQHYREYTENPELMAQANRAYDNVAKETVTHALQERMGTDLQLPDEPPTLHDQIEAAWAANSPKET